MTQTPGADGLRSSHLLDVANRAVDDAPEEFDALPDRRITDGDQIVFSGRETVRALIRMEVEDLAPTTAATCAELLPLRRSLDRHLLPEVTRTVDDARVRLVWQVYALLADRYARTLETLRRTLPEGEAAAREIVPVAHAPYPRGWVLAMLLSTNQAADAKFLRMAQKILAVNGTPPKTEGFDDTIRETVQRLCPAVIRSKADLERIAYWMAGRMEAIDDVTPVEGWMPRRPMREFNRVAYGNGLSSLLKGLPDHDGSAVTMTPDDVRRVFPPTDGAAVSEREALIMRLEERIDGMLAQTDGSDGGVLQRYLPALRAQIRRFAETWMPERTSSLGPICGLTSYVNELIYTLHFWMKDAGTFGEARFADGRHVLETHLLSVLIDEARMLHPSVQADAPDSADLRLGRTPLISVNRATLEVDPAPTAPLRRDDIQRSLEGALTITLDTQITRRDHQRMHQQTKNEHMRFLKARVAALCPKIIRSYRDLHPEIYALNGSFAALEAVEHIFRFDPSKYRYRQIAAEHVEQLLRHLRAILDGGDRDAPVLQVPLDEPDEAPVPVPRADVIADIVGTCDKARSYAHKKFRKEGTARTRVMQSLDLMQEALVGYVQSCCPDPLRSTWSIEGMISILTELTESSRAWLPEGSDQRDKDRLRDELHKLFVIQMFMDQARKLLPPAELRLTLEPVAGETIERARLAEVMTQFCRHLHRRAYYTADSISIVVKSQDYEGIERELLRRVEKLPEPVGRAAVEGLMPVVTEELESVHKGPGSEDLAPYVEQLRAELVRIWPEPPPEAPLTSLPRLAGLPALLAALGKRRPPRGS